MRRKCERSPSFSSDDNSDYKVVPGAAPGGKAAGAGDTRRLAHAARYDDGARSDDFLSFPAPKPAPGAGAGGQRGGAGGDGGSDLPPWVERPWDEARGAAPLVSLHNEVLRFCDLVSPTPGERRARATALGDVTRVLKGLFPGCTVATFGSELTGLCLPSSDLDMACLGTPSAPLPAVKRGAFMGGGFKGSAASPLHRFAKELRGQGLVSQLEVVHGAKVPIVKLVHATTQVSADVCFDETSGLQTGWFMRDQLALFPALRPLLLVLKYFLLQRGLNETYPTGGVGSFLLQLMALSFLQQRKRGAAANAAAEAEAAARRSRPPPAPRPEADNNLGALLLGFLELYGRTLNVDAVGISVRDGGAYFPKRYDRRQWVGGPPRTAGLLCVENPFLPDVDVGKNAFNFSNVQRAFRHGHMMLVEALATQTSARDAHIHAARCDAAAELLSSSSSSSSSASSSSAHSFAHPLSSEEKAKQTEAPPASALGRLLFADGVLLERTLPSRGGSLGCGGDNAGLFTIALPEPPQQRDLGSHEDEDEDEVEDEDDEEEEERVRVAEKKARKAEKKAAREKRRANYASDDVIDEIHNGGVEGEAKALRSGLQWPVPKPTGSRNERLTALRDARRAEEALALAESQAAKKKRKAEGAARHEASRLARQASGMVDLGDGHEVQLASAVSAADRQRLAGPGSAKKQARAAAAAAVAVAAGKHGGMSGGLGGGGGGGGGHGPQFTITISAEDQQRMQGPSGAKMHAKGSAPPVGVEYVVVDSSDEEERRAAKRRA